MRVVKFTVFRSPQLSAAAKGGDAACGAEHVVIAVVTADFGVAVKISGKDRIGAVFKSFFNFDKGVFVPDPRRVNENTCPADVGIVFQNIQSPLALCFSDTALFGTLVAALHLVEADEKDVFIDETVIALFTEFFHPCLRTQFVDIGKSFPVTGDVVVADEIEKRCFGLGGDFDQFIVLGTEVFDCEVFGFVYTFNHIADGNDKVRMEQIGFVDGRCPDTGGSFTAGAVGNRLRHY